MKIPNRSMFILFNLICLNLNAQESRTKISNEVILGLNGAGDQLGYIINLGFSKKVTKKNELTFRTHIGEFKGSKYQILKYGAYKSVQVFGFSITLNHRARISRGITFKPDAGIILRNHRWIVTTKNAFIEIGRRNTPPNSQAVWNDKTIGYTIALPFAWRVGSKLDMSIGPIYQNDTFGYTIFGGVIGLNIKL